MGKTWRSTPSSISKNKNKEDPTNLIESSDNDFSSIILRMFNEFKEMISEAVNKTQESMRAKNEKITLR